MNYKLTVTPALEMGTDNIVFMYATQDELENAAYNMADLLLFIQDHVKAMPDYSNIFIKETCITGEWLEI